MQRKLPATILILFLLSVSLPVIVTGAGTGSSPGLTATALQHGGLAPTEYSHLVSARVHGPVNNLLIPSFLIRERTNISSPVPTTVQPTPTPGLPALNTSGLPGSKIRNTRDLPSTALRQYYRPPGDPLTIYALPDSAISPFADHNSTALPTVIPTTAAPPESTLRIGAFSPAGGYVIITNTGTSEVSLTGYKIASKTTGRSITFIDFPRGDGTFFTYTLMPGRSVTVSTGRSGIPSASELFWPEELFNMMGDTVYLINPQGTVISSATN